MPWSRRLAVGPAGQGWVNTWNGAGGVVVFDFDTWPGLPTFVEIEGPELASVRQQAQQPGISPPATAPAPRLGLKSYVAGQWWPR